MISVAQAQHIIQEKIKALPSQKRALEEAFGNILAEDVYAPIDLPAFAQAGMDGYAFCFDANRSTYTIVGEVAAGDDQPRHIQPGEAVRIFTGAPVPQGADTVIMQERTEVQGRTVIVKDIHLQVGHNYRPAGSDIKQHDLAMKAGHRLTPAAIGFLAAMGITAVSVVPTPTVAILVTGDELRHLGEPLSFGQIYEANSFSLRAALASIGIHRVFVHKVGDDQAQLEKYIREYTHLSDLVLITGGVSVGDHDHTLDACRNVGVHILFHGVRQKPGKPLLFGMKSQKPVFGLPGNPSSVLTCFYQYVLLALGQLMQKELTLSTTEAYIQQDHTKPQGITHFIRATLEAKEVHIRKGQESYRLESFAHADAFIVLPEDITSVKKGDKVIVQKLPI